MRTETAARRRAALARPIAVGALLLLGPGCPSESRAPPVVPGPAAYAAAAREAPPALPPEAALPRLRDVTARSGLTSFVHTTGAQGRKLLPETMGAGAAAVDLDRDGRLDLVFADGHAWGAKASAPLRLFRGRGDLTFEALPPIVAEPAVYGMGVGAADLDRDGAPEIVLTALDGLRIYRADGRLAAHHRAGWLTAIALADFDRDGDLDIFAGGYVQWTIETDLFTTTDGKTKAFTSPRGYRPEPSRLYRNEGGLAFTETPIDAPSKTLGALADDFDDDGRLDIAVANDGEPNALLRNRGDGTFEDVGVRAGIAYDEDGRARAGMGIDACLLGPDLRRAIAITNFSREPNALFVETRRGSRLFTDQAGPLGMARPSLLVLGFGLRFLDVDLDGDEDCVVANGHIEPEIEKVEREITYEEPPHLFLGSPEGHFVLAPAFAPPMVARGLLSADFDRDGDEDLLFTRNGGAPVLFAVEPPAGNRSLRVDAPIGTVVTVAFDDGFTQRRSVRASGSYLSQSEVAAFFGIGRRDPARARVTKSE